MTPGSGTPNVRCSVAEIRAAGWLKLAVFFAVLAAAVIWATRQFDTPDPVPASAPTTEFSSERAFADLERIADEPRPVGSTAHRRTPAFLAERIHDAGLRPIVKREVAVDSEPADAQARAASATHVLARLKGTGDGPPIVLAAHYDSFSGGTPGAMDCGSCVVALLETMRALTASAPPRRDVWFVFTDAEERVSVGVHSLVDDPPLSEADTILNFEAGGSGGAPIVIQVSERSGAVVDTLLGEAPGVVANSMVPVLFAAAQAGDDFEVFADELDGFAGVDFANFLGRFVYHTDLDTLEEADRGTLQADGDVALGVTRALATETSTPQTDEKVFFTVAPGVTIAYPGWLGVALTALLATALIALVVVARRRGVLTIGSVLRGAGATLLSLLVAFVASVLLWELVALVNPGYDRILAFGRPITYNAPLYLGAFAAMTVAITALLVNRFVARNSAAAMTAGATVVCLLIAGLAVAAPGFTYLFVWPALFALAGAAWILLRNRAELGWGDIGALTVAALPGVVLISIAVTIIVLGLFGIGASGLPITTLGVPMILVALVVCLLALQLAATPRGLVPALAGLGTVGFLVAGQATSGFSDERPEPNVVAYELDADDGTARWISPGDEPDEWTRQFLGDEYTRAGYEAFLLPAYEIPGIAAEAPVADLPLPKMRVISDLARDGSRAVRLRIRSSRRAPNLLLDVDAEDPIVAATVEEVEVDRAGTPSDLDDDLELLYSAPPSGGVELELELKGDGPVAVELTDISEGLPDIPGSTFDPRPPDMQPLPTQALDPTIVTSTTEID